MKLDKENTVSFLRFELSTLVFQIYVTVDCFDFSGMNFIRKLLKAKKKARAKTTEVEAVSGSATVKNETSETHSMYFPRLTAEAVKSLLCLSALTASPAALTVGAKPKRRKADKRIEKRRRISPNPYLTCLNWDRIHYH